MRFALVVVAVFWQFTLGELAAQSNGYGLSASDQVFDTQALRAIAEQGDKRAAFLLASRYAAGRGVPRDDSEAVRWFTAAAEGGLAEAQYNLGIMYLSGRGVPLDPAKGAQWYERAAEQGLAEAQFNLGTLYGTGRGVRRDEALAVKWLTRAAQRGLAPAQYNLGALYEHGRGVRVNVHSALEWYAKAAAQGFDQAKFRHAALTKKMQISSQQGTRQESAAADLPTSQVAAAGAQTQTGTKVPAATSGPVLSPTDPDWIQRAPAGHYTIQLASFFARADAQRFARTLSDDVPVGINASSRGGKTYYSVLRGAFASHADALAAVAELPAKLRKMKPWIRRFAQLRK